MTINRQALLDAARDMLREYEEAHGRGEEMPYPQAAANLLWVHEKTAPIRAAWAAFDAKQRSGS